MGLGVQPQQKDFTIYTLICVWKQYFQLLNRNKIVTYIIILAPLTPHVIVLKDHPHHLTKYDGKETKISVFKLFSELGKIWKCNLSFSKIPIFHLFYELGKTWKYPQPQTNFQNPNLHILI